MGKARKRTTSTIITMVIVAIVILMLYYYFTNRTEPFDEASVDQLSEVELLINRDLQENYPETPREVVKLHSSILKVLYTDLKDEDVKALSLKMRGLYDQELLENNPEVDYLKNMYSEISEWKSKNRRITNYILVKKELEQKSEIDGREYADIYVSYTIQEKGKFSEVWRFLLRLSEDEKWKILGWTYVPEEEEQQ